MILPTIALANPRNLIHKNKIESPLKYLKVWLTSSLFYVLFMI